MNNSNGCGCTPNQSIKCTVSNCAHHCQDTQYCGLNTIQVGTHETNPTCIGVIFPACVISAVVYLLRGGVALSEAAPYLAGGLVGGWLGARLYGHIPLGVLRWLAAGVLLYGGVRYLL